MSPKIILTLVLSFVITCFSLFNTAPLSLSLFGIKTIQLPLSFFLFLVFLIGAIYAGLLTFYDQMQKTALNKKLKRKILSLDNKIEDLQAVIEKQERMLGKNAEQEERAGEDFADESLVERDLVEKERIEKKRVEEKRTLKQRIAKKRDKKEEKKVADEIDIKEVAKIVNPQLEIIDPHEEDNGKLTPQLREFAMKRIEQNA